MMDGPLINLEQHEAELLALAKQRGRILEIGLQLPDWLNVIATLQIATQQEGMPETVRERLAQIALGMTRAFPETMREVHKAFNLGWGGRKPAPSPHMVVWERHNPKSGADSPNPS